jgi:hypothetical protein
MAGPPRSEHDAAESAKRAGMAKYGDSLLLYCFSRVVKTQSPQHFVALLLEHRLVTGYEVETSEQDQLGNWNRPEDLSSG